MGRNPSHGEPCNETPPEERPEKERLGILLRRAADHLDDLGRHPAIAALLRRAALELGANDERRAI